jgi:predicted nucleic acid-binding Zn ribbon protein
MPTYVYETIPADPNTAPVQFEIRQSMNDQPLEKHPETGEPVRRIIAATAVVGLSSGSSTPAAKPPASCGPGCRCH